MATNTDHQKTAGNSVLYECVFTMMSIESESGLKVLAVNTIGRFLMSRDNNVKCVRFPPFFPPSCQRCTSFPLLPGL